MTDDVPQVGRATSNSRFFNAAGRPPNRPLSDLETMASRPRSAATSVLGILRVSQEHSRPFNQQMAELRIEKENTRLLNKLSVVQGMVGSFRKDPPPRLISSQTRRRRLETQRQNERLASKLIDVWNRDYKKKMRKDISEYLARRNSLRRHWGK